MATYFESLSATQRSNINYLISRMAAKGVTNPLSQAAMLAIVSKESGFIPKSEASYKNTPNSRIRSLFGNRVPADDASLDKLKKDDVAFFNAIYGGMYGNAKDEGYKYRGRGYNQLTFKGSYKAIGDKIGVDLVKNPDKANDPQVAADILIQFFIDGFKQAPKSKLEAYNTTGINDFKKLGDAVGAMYHNNAGWGHPVSKLQNDPTGGLKLAKERSEGFADWVGEFQKSGYSIGFFLLRKPKMFFKTMTPKKWAIVGGSVILIGTVSFFGIRYLKSKSGN